MTDIDFYILDQEEPLARERLACRLAEKVYKLGRSVHIHTESLSASQQLDNLLWTFRDGSFVPHALAEQASEPPASSSAAPVTISHDHEPQQHTDVLINLAADVPLFFSRFDRVTEIVGQQDKAAGRERFRFYRDRGYPLKSHNISA
jgi:DNA polymerase-3 subunit chi